MIGSCNPYGIENQHMIYFSSAEKFRGNRKVQYFEFQAERSYLVPSESFDVAHLRHPVEVIPVDYCFYL